MSNDSEANAAAWNSLGTAVSAGTAAIGQSVASKKQYERTQHLMEIQQQNQEKLNTTAYNRQMQMWEDTNFDAQRKQMEKAGLSVGMMYGGNGGGGSTVGSGATGQASGGHAPQQGMDIGSIVQATMAATQQELMRAQTKKIEEEAQAQKIDNEIMETGYGKEAKVAENSNRASSAISEGQILFEGKETPTNMFERLSHNEKEQLFTETIGMKIENEAKKANVELTKQQTEEIWHRIRQNWAQIGIGGISKIIQGVITKGK